MFMGKPDWFLNECGGETFGETTFEVGAEREIDFGGGGMRAEASADSDEDELEDEFEAGINCPLLPLLEFGFV
jgi:hypothetical protein